MDALDAFLAPALVLPVRGQGVRIPPPNAYDGLQLRRRLLGVQGRLAAPDEHDAIVQLLGYDRYLELTHELPEAVLLHVGRTALMHYCGSDELAVRYWSLGKDGQPALDGELALDESAPGYLGPDDPGGGPIVDAAAGIREWFNAPTKQPAPRNVRLDLSWRDVFACWLEVDLDLHERYGVDIHSGVLHDRPWPWLEARVRDLAMTPGTRLNRAILAPLRQN